MKNVNVSLISAQPHWFPWKDVYTAAPVTGKQATYVANNLWKIEKLSKNSKGTL